MIEEAESEAGWLFTAVPLILVIGIEDTKVQPLIATPENSKEEKQVLEKI